MVAAWLASLAGLHAPGDLRIAGLFPEEVASQLGLARNGCLTAVPFKAGRGSGESRRSVSTDPAAFDEFASDLVRTRLERPARRRPQPTPASWAGNTSW